ncbi:alpha-D-ribose 1-methylphosphonate 5-triphosphate diphosphatase [Paracoccus sp. Z118]|uniref:alpha-D-ribose 1-methylphosphonate 5-triphosphate diphosphatase n=1 Tax=Paracoccus sp. Z118 TaxID=2851017 RepID=UPI001C2C275B|nr:alpha-D-ribose 1-methylphosphonate 5-triphosphate diphosphatase [Paracoccus sp. Z118]MBV0891462.1 alpha-D-ribose 1-methylphosphonate 5-triphosphate diphosphatase [Paracoccus sp. Z118]
MSETVLANASLILPDRVMTGSLLIRGGLITGIDEGAGVPPGAIDCGGDHVAPGMVELHTDNLERHIQPRPGVHWPHASAIVAHDAELASVGITTVFDALRVGSIEEEAADYPRYARPLASEILAMRRTDALRISHYIHLRAEVCSETLVAELDEFSPEDRVGLVSLMDHTPGQRQFRDITKLAQYVQGKHRMSDEDFAAHIARLTDLQARYGALHEAAAVEVGKRLGAVLASHDDTTPEQVATSAGYGIRLAEFPTTMEAAHACRAHGIRTIMGAPNLVRGGSHSGNVAAADLARADRLDILSSDYVPSSLLSGAAILAGIWNDLPRAIATVTANPAAAAHLTDRGRLEVGLRADLIRFSMLGETPVLRESWSRGRRVA